MFMHKRHLFEWSISYTKLIISDEQIGNTVYTTLKINAQENTNICNAHKSKYCHLPSDKKKI